MIDIAPIVTVLVQLIAALLMAFGTYGIGVLVKRLGLERDVELNGLLNESLARAVAYAKARAMQAGSEPVKLTDSQLVAEAVNYVTRGAPDILSHFGVTPDRLEEMVLARLGADGA